MPTPTKTIWSSFPIANTVTSPSRQVFKLPRPAAAGDCIIIGGQYGSGSNSIGTITDDQSNAYWIVNLSVNDTTNSQTAFIASCRNVAAGTRVVTVTFTGALNFTQAAFILNVNNIDTSASYVDATAGRTTSGASLSAGNMTTTVTDTFVVTMAVEDAGAELTAPTTYTAQSAYELCGANPFDETCAMFGMQAPAGTINPALTSSRSWSSAIAIAVAFKTTTAGGEFSNSIQPAFLQFINFNASKCSLLSGTSFTFNVPCSAGVNGLSIFTDDGNNIYSSISSTPSNTWTATATTNNGVAVRNLYTTQGSYSGTMTVTVTTSLTPSPTVNPFELVILGLRNAGAFDQVVTGSGSTDTVPPVTTNNVLSSGLTPAEANELLFFYLQEVQQTVTGITATSGTPLGLFQDLGVYESLVGTHDSGPAILIAPPVAATNINVSWSDYESGLQVSQWACQMVAFKSAPFVQEAQPLRTNSLVSFPRAAIRAATGGTP